MKMEKLKERIAFVGMISVAFLASIAPSAVAGGESPLQAGGTSKGLTITAQGAFDKIKKLQGEWVATVDSESGPAETISFRVTAAGSAVMETQFAGTAHEMINMYHRDGEDLRLTHYCAAGNQPQMKLLRTESKPEELVFDFVGGTNMNPETDLHIHSARIIFHGDDDVESVWTSQQGKNKGEIAKFILKRKKEFR